MLLGAIADDFTGASDLANTLAKGGMSTVQFAKMDHAPVHCEAGVVALKTRSAPVQDAVDQSIAAARWLLDQGCEQILFKYCSTFDSTPAGNIGPVAEALLDLLGADAAVVCPAFPATGRRVFMGHLFVGDRLLNESGMERHPLTPMTDPDLRRWLRQQTRAEVGGVALDRVRAGKETLTAAFETERHAGRRLIVVDAVTDEDLRMIGQTIANHRLVSGASGIALGLPSNFRAQGRLAGRTVPLPRVSGRAVVLCGSCSPNSQRQVAEFLIGHPGLAIEPVALLEGTTTVDAVLDWVEAQGGETPIIYSTATADAVAGVQSRFGRQFVAETIEAFFGALARALVARGARRIVVGGGETSGAVIGALSLASLEIGAEIDPGVPILIAGGADPLALALKSGNFGTTDFFAKALERIGTG